MNEQLPPFTEHPTCIKCGHNKASAIWAESREQFDQYSLHLPYLPERIIRRCGRCSYEWHEAPLDPRLQDCAFDKHDYGAKHPDPDGSGYWRQDCRVPGCSAGMLSPREVTA